MKKSILKTDTEKITIYRFTILGIDFKFRIVRGRYES